MKLTDRRVFAAFYMMAVITALIFVIVYECQYFSYVLRSCNGTYVSFIDMYFDLQGVMQADPDLKARYGRFIVSMFVLIASAAMEIISHWLTGKTISKNILG